MGESTGLNDELYRKRIYRKFESGVLYKGIKGLYEGLKAYRTEDGRIMLFRPDQNALRLQSGAHRLCMPYPSVDQFVSAVKQVVLANKKWVCIKLE
ncbi:unnamed protein product [Brassica napus]|uniref:(rape) hypothetical protein n=1 Tax=Brassica napus TaxID=3708 RepID=A0A816IB63_BRANA|nr:unnamed protein product [Brassica napus]